MNYQEYFKCSTMTYREYCKYLQDKYGIPKNSYYNEQYNKNKNSRTSEGLVIHHICEDIKPNLSNKEVAKSCDFSYQLPENLCYCDYLEHLFLHILITEYPNEETEDVVGIGGSANYLIPELNNLFSGYIPEQPSKKYVIDCFDRVKDDFITYKYLISRFLSNNDVQKERLVSVVLSGDKKYFNEESKIYSELKNICDSGSCVQSHNIEIYSKVENLLNAQNKALLVLGTGLGKTSTALSYALKYGYRVLVVCPRDNIKDTWEIYSPVVSTISYVSLANEAETFDYSKYDLIVFDEAHHLNAPIWGKGIRHLLDNNVNIKILGLTATPLCDGGKKNIADIFFKDCTVVGYDAIEGIKAGVLHPVSYVCSFYTKPKEIDEALEKCKESTDELTMKLKGRLDLALNNTPTLKEIITSNMPHGNRKGIIFAQTIEDMDEAIKILKDIYPNEEYRKIHSLMNREEVQNIKEWFSNTDSGYLCTVDMISEGSHYKGVNTIFMFRKTKSGNLFEQQLGRCMTQTSLPNPHCIVFDLVNNMRNVREFTARLADAISEHGIVKTLKGERNVSPDLLSGGAKISKQYVVEDYTRDIVDAYDELNRLYHFSAILRIDTTDGSIKKYDKIVEAELEGFSRSGIIQCCKRKAQKSGGYYWAYERDFDENWEPVEMSFERNSNSWSEEEIEIIRKYYPFEGSRGCTKRLKNRKVGAVNTLAKKIGIKYIGDLWQPEEDDIIKKYYPIEGSTGCAQRLSKRTPQSILSRASKLGVNLDALWSENELELLKYYYPLNGAKGCEKYLPNKTISQISYKAQTLKLTSPISNKNRQWTPEEDEIIRTNYSAGNTDLTHLIPNKSKGAIQQRASVLGVKVINNWTEEEIKWMQDNSYLYTREELIDKTGKSWLQIGRILKKYGLKYCTKVIKWTEEEDSIIKKYYPKEGGKVYLRLKNRTYSTVVGRASALGIKYDNEENRKWTKEEDIILKENYIKLGKNIVNLLPGRTFRSIITRAKKLE